MYFSLCKLFQAAHRLRKPQSSRVQLTCEQLEPRSLLSTAAWQAIGPAPITGETLVATPAGGDGSGRITSIAVDPNDATGNTVYVGSAGGGVWKTINSYNSSGPPTWLPLTDNVAAQVGNPLVTLTVGSLAVASLPAATANAAPTTLILAGLGEANADSTSMVPFNAPSVFYGQGILRSLDGGNTWALVGNAQFSRSAIGRIVIDPSNNQHILAAVATSENGVTGNEGIWQSFDQGNTWANTTLASGIPDTVMFSDVAFNPANPQIVFAAAGEPLGNAANGLYTSTNGGTTWALVPTFPNGIYDGRITLAISPSNPSIMYASIIASNSTNPNQSEPLHGLYELAYSTNGGANWTGVPGFIAPATTMNDAFPDPAHPIPNYVCGQGCQGSYDTTLIVDPNNPYHLFAGGNDEILSITLNPSQLTQVPTFTDLQTGIHVDHHAIAFDSLSPPSLLVGTDGGAFRLPNPNTNTQWTNLNGNLQVSQFYGIGANPTNPSQVYGALQDNGTPYANGSSGLSWARVNGSFEDDGGPVWVDPNNIGTVYTVAAGTIIKSTNAFSASPTFVEADTGVTTGSEFLGNFPNTSLLLDTVPGRSNRLWYATNVLYMSTTGAVTPTGGGTSWTQITQLGQNGWAADNNSFIDSIAVSTSNPNVLYVTARGGRVYMTTNLPSDPTTGPNPTWTRIDPIPLANVAANPFLKLAGITVNPFNPQLAYVVAAAFSDATGGGQVWMTTTNSNGSLSWQNISGNLPDVPVWSIAVDANGTPTTADDILYAGTDIGMYYSTNQGITWTPYGTGLPNTQVRAIDLNTTISSMIVGTWGHGAYSTQPVPLRQNAYATGTDAGTNATVTVNDVTGGQAPLPSSTSMPEVVSSHTISPPKDILPYPGFTGGVRVAVGDINGDSIPDTVTAPGPGGGPEIEVFSGKDQSILKDFWAFNPAFAGGVYVAVGDVNADGFADIICGADAGGGPNIAIFSGKDFSLLKSFFAFDPRFIGGVRVALGDTDHDGKSEIIAGAGPGGGPNVVILNGATGKLIRSFFAFDPAFAGGIFLAAGDANGDSKADVIIGAGPGGGPDVVVASPDGVLLSSFFAYDPNFLGGVRVGAVDYRAKGRVDVLVAPGSGGGPDVGIHDSLTGKALDHFFARDSRFTGGLFVAGSGR